jgi:signal transduction histidine kinase
LSFQEYETQVKFTDEKFHDIIFYKASLQNSENEFAGLVGIMLDITERKKQEFQLERSKKSLQEAQKIGSVGHWEYDVINDNMYMSEQMYRIYELERETFNPTIDKVIALIHPNDKDYVVNTYNETFTKTLFFEIEHKVITAKGNLKYIKDKAETHFDEKGNPTRIISNVQDITDLKLKELKLIENNKIIEEYAQELKKLNDDKDRFIRILAHDLKNPFNSLLGFSELLLKNLRKYDIEKIEKQLNVIHKTSKQTYNLLEDLLLWSKSQSGKLPFEPQTYLFSEICNKLISNFKTNSKNIVINCLETEGTKIIADLNILKTVMRNLVSNAIKFTNQSGSINIFSEKTDKNVIITVSDNGIGIPEENITNLWDYTQLITTSGTEGEGGTGFGLALCKEFVEKHGGQIWVESEIGKGSDFKFTLPLQYE